FIDLDDEEDDEDSEVEIAWQRCGAAFTELRGELTDEESREYRRRLEGRRVDALRPRDPAEARAELRSLVEQAVTRLEAERGGRPSGSEFGLDRSVLDRPRMEPPLVEMALELDRDAAPAALAPTAEVAEPAGPPARPHSEPAPPTVPPDKPNEPTAVASAHRN